MYTCKHIHHTRSELAHQIIGTNGIMLMSSMLNLVKTEAESVQLR